MYILYVGRFTYLQTVFILFMLNLFLLLHIIIYL